MEATGPPTAREAVLSVLLDGEQRRKLFGYACSRFGIGSEDAEDLLQETALALLQQRSYVRSPEGFVFAVFRSRCARFIGAKQARRAVFADEPSPQGDAAGPMTGVEIDRLVALREALAAVSSSCRRLLAAYYVEGQTLREAARTMALASSSVSKTISRCLRRLRKCLS